MDDHSEGPPDGQEDAHTSPSQLNKDTPTGGCPEPEVSWVGTAKTIRSPMFCRYQDRHMASREESSNTYRCQGPKDGNGLSSGLKRFYSDTGKQFWEGREAPGSRCIPHQNKPASHDCNYKPSSSLGVNEAFGMMG